MKKLVRDGIPQKIRENGEVPVCRTLSEDEYVLALHAKLREETDELIEAEGLDIAEEAGDLIEVIQALLDVWGMTLEEALKAGATKREKLGAFKARVFLEQVHVPKP